MTTSHSKNDGARKVCNDEDEEILIVKLIGNGRNHNIGDFTEFLTTGQFSDLILKCDDGQFVECHRLLLASRAVNFKYFASSRSFLVSEITFRRCVKIEHLQALVQLAYQCQINGEQHEITSTLWKLIKIFGIRVSAKCYSKNPQNGHTELEHELENDTPDHQVNDPEAQERGAAKFERVVKEFRCEAKRRIKKEKVNKENSNRANVLADSSVILISDEEQRGADEGRPTSSCSSDLSSLSGSTSDLSQKNGPEEEEMPRKVEKTIQRPQIRIKDYAKLQNGAPQPEDGLVKNNGVAGQVNHIENSAIAGVRRGNKIAGGRRVDLIALKRADIMHDWDSSESSGSSSEGEYREKDYVRPLKAQKVYPKASILTGITVDPKPVQCLQYNQNEMSIIVKPMKENDPNVPKPRIKIPISQLNVTQQQPKVAMQKHANVNPVHDTESENIICSPQLLFNIKTEPLDEERGEEIEIEPEITADHEIKLEIVEEDDFDDDGHPLQHFTIAPRRQPPPLLIPLPTSKRLKLDTSFQRQSIDDSSKLKVDEGDEKLKQLLSELMKKDGTPTGQQLPSFVLRNPRGNQQRTYTTDSLWAALMDVKSGESIYRASQQHKVPRKTLRNWMKRCHIKSAYPMPDQLRAAAEKKKQERWKTLITY